MAPYQALDDLIREYLLFRGFASSLKAFDLDIKAEKEKGFRADKITDQMLQHVSNHDLASMRELWQHLNNKLFRRLDPTQTSTVGRLESGFLKLYVINCIQTRHHDKLKEFFEKMANELQGQHEWREWFALPFLILPASNGGGYGNIDSNPIFSAYFTRQWQDTLLLSFHNFLMLVFASAPAPRLADYWSTGIRIKKLKDENQVMRRKLGELQRTINQFPSNNGSDTSIDKVIIPNAPAPPDIMDDFYIIAQDSTQGTKENISDNTSSETQVKTLTKFLRNITGSTAASSPSNSGTSVGNTSNSLNISNQMVISSILNLKYP